MLFTKKMTRLLFVIPTAALFVFSSAVSAAYLFINAKGYTLNAKGELVQFSALAFDKDKITGVFKTTPNLKPYSKVFDARGRTLLPGLIDAHGHVLGYGESLRSIDLVNTESLKDALGRIRSQTETSKEHFFTGFGWNQEMWPDKAFPTARDLDAVESKRPVILARVDVHAVWVNSVVMELAGITADTPSPEGGEIVKDENGQPTGVFIDNAMAMVTRIVPAMDLALRKQTLRDGLLALADLGLTSVHDAGIDLPTIQAYKALQREGLLPVRVYAMLDMTAPGYQDILKMGSYHSPDNMFVLRSVKISADGALGSRGAALHEDYSDLAGQQGLLLHSKMKLERLVTEAMQANFQVNTHAIGDKANTMVLDAYAKWMDFKDKKQLRHRIEHAQIIRPQDLARFKDLSIIASMQPTHATSDKNMAEDRVGKARMKGAYAWATLEKMGVMLAGGSDFPVEPAEPFYGLHAAVTRQDRKGQPLGGWYANEKVSKKTAFAMFTYNAAYAAHQEDRIGTLEVGKQADFIIIDRDFFTVPDEDIWRIRTLQTWVNGKRVTSPRRRN